MEIMVKAFVRTWSEFYKLIVLVINKIDYEPRYCCTLPEEFYYKSRGSEMAEKVSETQFYINLENTYKTVTKNFFGMKVKKEADNYVINRDGNVWTLIIL